MNLLSSLKVTNKPNRNAFDMSERVSMSACSGALQPVTHMHLSPGDKVKGIINFFDRTEALVKAPFANILEQVDVFFVPYRIIWAQSDAFFTSMSQRAAENIMSSVELDVTNVPAFTMRNAANIIRSMRIAKDNFLTDQANRNISNPCLSFYGPDRGEDMIRLLEYLGYGDFVELDTSTPISSPHIAPYKEIARENRLLNALPLLAYHKIYYDFYRNTQWENEQPHMYFVNSPDNTNPLNIVYPEGNYINQPHVYDLHYCNYEKDKFLGVLPHAQFGQPSVVNTLSTYGIDNSYYLGVKSDGTVGAVGNSVYGVNPTLFSSKNLDFNFSILALRQATAMQKWKEISQFTSTDYKHQVKAHWDVDVSDARSNLVTWIKGASKLMDINPVINQNLDNDGEPTTKATSTNAGLINIDFTAPEHGMLFVMYHNKPLLQYDGRYTPLAETLKIHNADFPIPEFDSTGMESLEQYSMDVRTQIGSGGSDAEMVNNDAYGYSVRFIDWKARVDRTLGNMCRTNSSYNITLPKRVVLGKIDVGDPDYHTLNQYYCRWKVAPNDVGSIFFMTKEQNLTADPNVRLGFNDFDTDQFNLNVNVALKKVSNLNYSGMPY